MKAGSHADTDVPGFTISPLRGWRGAQVGSTFGHALSVECGGRL